MCVYIWQIFIVRLRVPGMSQWSIYWELQIFYYFDPEALYTAFRVFNSHCCGEDKLV